MKIVMLREAQLYSDDADLITVVGVYENEVENDTILDEVFVRYGFTNDNRKQSLCKTRTVNGKYYHLCGGVEIHVTEAVGLLKCALDV